MEKKKGIKIRFTVAIIIIELVFLISMMTVYYIYHFADNKKRTKNSSITVENNQEQKENIKIERDITKDIERTSKYEWEEYPNDDKWMDNTIVENVKKDRTSLKLARKSLYSLNNNKIKSFDERYYNIFGIGDSTKIIDWTSNYARYCYPDNEKNNLSSKYTDKISYDIAVFNVTYYDGYYDLETCVKNQYDKVVVKKDYQHYENVSKSFYYEIPNMFIMNGNNESEEDYKNNSRAKKIKVTINKEKEYTFELKDTNKVQVFDIGYKQSNIEKPVNIEVEVLDTYKGEKTEDIYISDIQFGIESNIPQGR